MKILSHRIVIRGNSVVKMKLKQTKEKKHIQKVVQGIIRNDKVLEYVVMWHSSQA